MNFKSVTPKWEVSAEIASLLYLWNVSLNIENNEVHYLSCLTTRARVGYKSLIAQLAAFLPDINMN